MNTEAGIVKKYKIKMTLKDLNTFINNWDEELHGKF